MSETTQSESESDAVREAALSDDTDERQPLTKAAISGTVTGYVVDPGTGEQYDAEFKDISGAEREELTDLEDRAMDGDPDAEREFERLVINEYLLNDDFTAANTGQAMKGAILVGFLRALGADNEAITEAETFFDERLNQGNR